MSRLGEFDYIAQYLAPLAAGCEGAFGLTDDAAQIASRSGLVITTDTLVEGVHFRKGDPWDLVARKALRVNLSDLAAMGADPHAVLLSIVWPVKAAPDAMAAFAEGLKTDLTHFDIPLIGGDTTRGGDRLVVTFAALGETDAPLRRSAAKPGEDVYVSGTIGDAGLGLAAAKQTGLNAAQRDALNERYLLPQPRHELAAALRGNISAAIDISDGLIADAGHVAAASGLGLRLHLTQLPLSDAAKSWVNAEDDPVEALVTLASRGDDYELLFCAPVSRRDAIAQASNKAGVPVTRVGTCHSGEGVLMLDASGKPVEISRRGFTHF
ncbi:thiamine-phosphate kinase [Hyphobacterium sp.]|uniref:thiamine-phosphate kinase n=1 Tax=Hyphobacterium sp. TaxID=2004662 RepID=UPI003BAA0A9E